MTETLTAPSIVVGIDGSRNASRAAVWAITEAVGHDLPLHLVAVSEATDPGPARTALAEAADVVAAAGCDVTVATAIVTADAFGGPALALLGAARAAAMICVGGTGLRQFDIDRVGYEGRPDMARVLVASAHCPVAVVRGPDRPGGWVVVEVDGTPDSAAVLQYGVEEARLRQAPLRVLGTWQSDGTAVEDAERMVRAQLDRRLEQWRHRYPDLDVVPVAVPGSGLGYLTEHAGATQLVVVGSGNTGSVDELLGPRHPDCSVLAIDPQRLL